MMLEGGVIEDKIKALLINKMFMHRQKKTRLSEDNVNRRNKVAYLEKGDRDLLDQVQKRLKNQEKLNSESDRLRSDLLTEVNSLRTNLTEAKREILDHSHCVQNTRLLLSGIEARVHGLNQQRARLEQASREYGVKGSQAFRHVPVEFFSELHREY